MEEVPTGAKVETVKDSTEPVTGATVTAVTSDFLKVTVVFMLMPMIPFLFAQANRTKPTAGTQAGEVPNHQEKPPCISAR